MFAQLQTEAHSLFCSGCVIFSSICITKDECREEAQQAGVRLLAWERGTLVDGIVESGEAGRVLRSKSGDEKARAERKCGKWANVR